MAKKLRRLIHTALQAEADPIIAYFGLRLFASKPFKIFKGGSITLIISGMGRKATQKALENIFAIEKFQCCWNVGIAGCNDNAMEIGTLVSVRGGPEGIPVLPIQTVDRPATYMEENTPLLVDMETEQYIHSTESFITAEHIHVIKVVSDHLSDRIPSKSHVRRLIGGTLPKWGHLIDSYPKKLHSALELAPLSISHTDKSSIHSAALHFRFSYQEIKQLLDMAVDFATWDITPMNVRLKTQWNSREHAFKTIRQEWNTSRNSMKSYTGFSGTAVGEAKKILLAPRQKLGFGRCPVASERTRCCNLYTLDAVEGCGFDCSYCSIRYFYDNAAIRITDGFLDKIQHLKLDPEKIYHIGTGQSSDSLMWGNHGGVLDGLLDFASKHPNVILELKTKSNNIDHLLKHKIPANVITTWSLSPQIIIKNEEHRTASLQERVAAAEALAKGGNLVGFHFHPMVHYSGWDEDYATISQDLLSRFNPQQIVMISLGTLTFTRAVIKKMRDSTMKSRILQMPLVEADGKLSYPLEVKRKMFSRMYKHFKPWHDAVFFYLCMESPSLWSEVFGFDYIDNATLESAMLKSYSNKIETQRKKAENQ